MTLGQLKRFCENTKLDDDMEVMVFNEEHSSLDEINGICINGRAIQLNVLKPLKMYKEQ